MWYIFHFIFAPAHIQHIIVLHNVYVCREKRQKSFSRIRTDNRLIDKHFAYKRSHLLQVRGLKHFGRSNSIWIVTSHLLQVRGLKPRSMHHLCWWRKCRTSCRCVDWNLKWHRRCSTPTGRTSCRCVDWNIIPWNPMILEHAVAPLAGAWIET